MEVTELGMVTLVRAELFSNADAPIEVTELGIIVFLQPQTSVFVAVSIIALQLLRESYFGFPLSIFRLVNPMQPKKALLLIEVTELGMAILVRLVQPLKTW